mgnify:CR=1 FL=1
MISSIKTSCKLLRTLSISSGFKSSDKDTLEALPELLYITFMDSMDVDTEKYACEHCEWKGKSILQHLRYHPNCKEKTDLELLRKVVQEKNKQKKVNYQRQYDLQHRQEKVNYQRQYNSQHRQENVNYQRQYDSQHRQEKVSYQRQYDSQHRQEKAEYNLLHRAEKRKYDREHKNERKVRHKFFKYFSSPNEDTSRYYPGFSSFKTPATIHMFRHSIGECSPDYYRIDDPDEKTVTAHEIDHSVKDEVCLNCGNNLIKLHNINRLQCVKCYSAQCYVCKASVSPNLDMAYQHFWTTYFNNFVPELCPYFENSGKFDMREKETCDSCERSDQGAKKSILQHFSEEKQKYICNDKCPSEPFSTICEALTHVLRKHPKRLCYGDSGFPSSDIMENGHVKMADYDYMFDLDKNESVEEFVVEGREEYCFCSYTKKNIIWDDNYDYSSFPPDPFVKRNIDYLRELKQRAIFEDGVYRCTVMHNNDRCTSEPFSTICEALKHVLQQHPWDEFPRRVSKDTLKNGHIKMKKYDIMYEDIKISKKRIEEVVVEGNESCFCSYKKRGANWNADMGFSGGHNSRYLEELKRRMTYENGVYKCQFTCNHSFIYPCQMWSHLEYENGNDKHWYTRAIEGRGTQSHSRCGLDGINTENKPDIKFENLKIRNKGNDFDAAKEWIKGKVKKILPQICCCQEYNNDLFCIGKKHHDEIPEQLKIFQCNYFKSESSEQDLFPYLPFKGWHTCCKKCETSGLNLPVEIDGMYVKLPANVFVFSKCFKSFVKMSDCQRPVKIHCSLQNRCEECKFVIERRMKEINGENDENDNEESENDIENEQEDSEHETRMDDSDKSDEGSTSSDEWDSYTSDEGESTNSEKVEESDEKGSSSENDCDSVSDEGEYECDTEEKN